MNFRIEYKDIDGKIFHEDQYSAFVLSESDGTEWINSQNLKYSDRHFLIESFVRNPVLESFLANRPT